MIQRDAMLNTYKEVYNMISPAIHFPGNCNEAIHFYEQVFGGTEKHIDYYRDAPDNPGFVVTSDMKNQVMHATMTICGTPVNFSDTQDETSAGNMICLNVFMPSPQAVCNAFNQLKDGGKIIVQLGPQFFSTMYGSIEDKYGIKWQLIA